MESAVRRGFDIWKEFLDKRIDTWSDTRTTPVPIYIVEPPSLSADRKILTVEISGDPGSYGAMKLFEDGVPYPMYGILDAEVRRDVEICYENPELGPPQWIRVGDSVD
jgi:hypothetical protein